MGKNKDIYKKVNKGKNKIYINIIAIVISVIALCVLFLDKYLVNENLIDNIIYMINLNIKILLGKSAIVFFVFVIIYNFVVIKRRNTRIRTNTIRKIIGIIAFLVFSMILTVIESGNISTNSIYDAGADLLSNAFEFKGGGIIGSIITTPFYNLINKEGFLFSLIIILFLLSIIISFKNIRKIYLLIVNTKSYYNSEEYKNKQNILKAKREYEKKIVEEEIKREEEEFANIIVNKTNRKIDAEISKKLSQDIIDNEKFYTQEELVNKEQEWKDFYNRLHELKRIEKEERIRKEEEALKKKMQEENNLNEEIKNEKVEEIEERTIDLKENINDFTNNIEYEDEKEFNNDNEKIVEEEYEKVIYDAPKTIVYEKEKLEEVKEIQKKEEIKLDLENIFEFKNIDPSEKEKMLDEINNNIHKLENVLSTFGVEGKVIDFGTGPTITRYEIKIPENVRVKKVTELEDEIAMHLKAESLRMEAPIPGKDTIGIELPNKIKEHVYFANLITSPEIEKGILPVILGKDIVGKEKIIDITKLPHLLIAGTTGSGKSICINTIISSLISKKSSEDVRLILIDPKMVELMPYNGIAHLLTPVIIDPHMAATALKWAVNEMEGRYKKLASVGERNIEGYNLKYRNDKLPYIVIIIDELADLMLVASNSVEESIARIAQKARAVGIHLILATQRPSVNVVTGLIKANLPSRISFALNSPIDSRTILDQMGAEKLLGKGDMLFLDNGKRKLERLQGAYISDEEVKTLTEAIIENSVVDYNEEIFATNDIEDDDSRDPLFEKAVELAKEQRDKLTVSYIQRRLKVGYNRAARICDELKSSGILDEDNRYIEF